MKKLHWTAWITIFASYRNLLLYIASLTFVIILLQNIETNMQRPYMDTITTATVLESKENRTRTGLHGWDYKFSYTVNGISYSGKSQEPSSSQFYPSYSVGETVYIVYNPNYPHISEMFDTTNKTYFLPVSVGLALIFIFSLVISVWRGVVRSQTLRYGEITQGKIGRHRSEYKVSHTIGKRYYYRNFVFSFKLREKESSAIIYHPHKPDTLYVLERSPVKYCEKSNKWRPAFFFFIIRMAVIALVVLFSMVLMQ
ncbi:hypothetical protein D3P09_02545 [Paenibacillus pinisoli]|uniref:DUF3592 domain-containing protein n=1 Tax=Paenibacillus pinisoli TaxID=1276110 RepID=A0A3A6PI74_9BACL|nr:DUF3592 domain-containing protein [Paenibacillus pinisoli]RJX40917.1 hypothetical protein D3P09_02545 [Paenibacillus pinisoli]